MHEQNGLTFSSSLQLLWDFESESRPSYGETVELEPVEPAGGASQSSYHYGDARSDNVLGLYPARSNNSRADNGDSVKHDPEHVSLC